MKKLFNLFLIALVAISLVTTSCKDEDDDSDDTTTPTAAKFDFLKAGRTWTYYYDDVLTDEMVISTTSADGSNLYTMNLDGSTEQWFMSDNVFGWYDDATSTTEIICKADAKLNDVYTKIDGIDTSMYKVEGLNVSKTVNAGTFSCYKVGEYNGGTLGGYFYINKNVGIIAFEGDGGSVKLKSKNF